MIFFQIEIRETKAFISISQTPLQQIFFQLESINRKPDTRYMWYLLLQYHSANYRKFTTTWTWRNLSIKIHWYKLEELRKQLRGLVPNDIYPYPQGLYYMDI